MQSGLAYTILRPGRLTDGPYTSYDLNTLLKATAGNKQDVQIAAKDELNGETSRIALAGMLACICKALSMHIFQSYLRVNSIYVHPSGCKYSICLSLYKSCKVLHVRQDLQMDVPAEQNLM